MADPPRKVDRLTVGVYAVLGVVFLVCIVQIAPIFTAAPPASSPAPSGQSATLGEWVRNAAREISARVDSPAWTPPKAPPAQRPPAATPAPAKSAAPPPVPAQAPPVATVPQPASSTGPRLNPGERWTYAVTLEPKVWSDAELIYETFAQPGSIGVRFEFLHGPSAARQRMAWTIGPFRAGDPVYANVRFPGFFVHTAHFPLPLEIGRELEWSYPWQGPAAATKPDRKRRFAAYVAGWEKVKVPAGTFDAARIVVLLQYIDGGRVQAEAQEILWYSPEVRALVKAERLGGTPDEGAQHIVAELRSFMLR